MDEEISLKHKDLILLNEIFKYVNSRLLERPEFTEEQCSNMIRVENKAIRFFQEDLDYSKANKTNKVNKANKATKGDNNNNE